MKKYHVYGIGAALVDTEIEVKDDDLTKLNVEKGMMTLVDTERRQELINALEDHLIYSKRASGGSAGNTIIAASYFGAQTFFSGKVANDDNGKFYLNDMTNAGVSIPDIENEQGITGKCLILITPDAERSMNTYLGISEQLSERELDYQAISESEYLYIESYLVTGQSGKDTALKAIETAKNNQTKIALSFSDPGIVNYFKSDINDLIGNYADIIFCNKDEALAFTETTDINEAINAIRKITDHAVITLGAEGALVTNSESTINIPGVKVDAVDTNGAGDMFAGAYLYGITHKMSPEQAGNFASKAAAKVVSQYGPRLKAEEHQTLL